MLSKWRQHTAAILANMTTLQAGYLLGWTSPVEELLDLSKDEISWVTSLALLGALIGAMPAGWLAELMGRKRFLIMLAAPYTLGGALLTGGTAIHDVWMMYAGRFISGLALGASTVAVPIYSNEIAEDSVRGTLGVYLDMMLTVGILVVYSLGVILDPPHLAAVSCIAPPIFAAMFMCMPESPAYLVSAGKFREAEKSLKWLRGGVKTDDVEIQLELARIRSTSDPAAAAANQNGVTTVSVTSSANGTNPLSLSASGQITPPLPRSRSGSISGVRQALRRLSCRSATARAFFIVVGLMVFMQLSGIDAVISYLGNIFADAGSTLKPLQASIVVGVVQVFANICSSLLVDRVGRRVLLLLSEGFMAASLAVLSFYFYQIQLYGNEIATEYGWVPVIALSVYIWVFAVGIGSLPWFMMAELLPADSIDWGSSTCICLNWSLGFFVTNVFNSIQQDLGSSGTYAVLCAICVVGTVFVGILVPETKGRSPEEIQRLLAASRTYCSVIKTNKNKPAKV